MNKMRFFYMLIVTLGFMLMSISQQISAQGKLKGIGGGIPSLEKGYCNDESGDTIVPANYSSTLDSIVWRVYTQNDGVDHPAWFDIVTGSNGIDSSIVFYPDRVDASYYNDYIIVVKCSQYVSGFANATEDGTYVFEIPVYDLSPANASMCDGDSTILQLNNSTVNVNYYLFKDGVAYDTIAGTGSSIDFRVGDEGNYTVTAISKYDYNEHCPAVMNGSSKVTVNPNPTITVDSNTPLCAGSDLNLTSNADNGTPAYNYSWTGPMGFTSNNQNPTIAAVDTVNGGQYIVTVVDSKGCTNSATTNVIVNDNPTVTASNDGPVCEDGKLILSADVKNGTGPYDYSWNGVDGFSSNDPNPEIDSITLNKAGKYYITVTDANGCGSSTDSTTVVVNKLPVVNPANDGPVCEFGTLNLTAGPDDNGATPYSFSWTGPDGFNNTNENPSISNVSLQQAGTYTVIATDQNGCSSLPGTTDVVVHDAPVATADNDSPVCEGGILTLSGSAAEGTGTYTYSWTGPNGLIVIAQNPVINNIQLNAAGTYTLTVSDGNCTDITTTDVIVNPNPTVTADNDGPVCENGTLTLASTPIGGTGPYTFSWSGPGTYSSNDQNPVINNITQLQAGTYQVNITDNNGCSNVLPGSTDVIVNENPTVTAGNDGPVCEDETLHLGSSPSGGDGNYTYSWTGPSGYTSTAKDPTITNISLTQAGDYIITVTDGNSCSSNADTTAVVVNDAPVASITNISPVCEGDALTLTGSATEGTGTYTYTWTKPDGTTVTGAVVTINNIDPSQAGTYTLTVDDGNCTDVVTTDVIVNSAPTVTADNDGPVCEKTTLNLTSRPTGGSGTYLFAWTGPDGFTSAVQNPVISGVTGANAGTYNVTVTDANGCSNIVPASTDATIYPAPTVTALSNTPLCENETLKLEANGSGGTGILGYNWSGPDGFTSNDEDPVVTNVPVSQAGNYTVIVTDANSCTDTATTVVDVFKVTAGISISTPSPGGTVICAGTAVTFNASGVDGSGDYNYDFHIVRNGIDNSVQNSNAVTYTTSTLEDGDEVYVIVIDNTTTCTDQSTSIIMTVNPNPVVDLNITSPGGNTVCQGADVIFEATSGYTNYVFYLNNVEVQNGASNVYTNSSLVDGDEVYVEASSSEDCSASAPPITMIVHDVPAAAMTANPGTDIIAGTNVIFTGSGGTQYEFFVNGVEVQALSADDTYESNTLVDGDVVSVNVYNADNCVSTATLTMIVRDAITALDVSASDTEYCEGSGGVSIYIATPQNGVTYDLIRTSDDNLIGTITFDGTNSVQWDNIPGTEEYKVEGYYLSVPSSRVEMNNRITVVENPLPGKYGIVPAGEVTGCNGGAGYEIKLDGSDVGISYQLLLFGGNVGSPVAGTGSGISFGNQRTFGLYTIIAIDDVTGCSVVMNNSFEIKSDGVYNIYDVTGDGEFCEGSAGANINLSGSDTGVEYRVLRDGVDIGDSWIADVDTGHVFGPYVTEGNYTVIVNTSTGCRYPMSGSVDVVEVPLPASFDLAATNGGHFCIDDATGVNITISGQETGIEYQLYHDGTFVTSVTGTIDDATAPLSFGNYNVVGQYSVTAVVPSVGCSSPMNNEIILVADPLPVVYDVTSDGDYCTGSVTYLHLNGSEADVQYRWERESDGAVGPWVDGNGGLLDFEITGTDTYFITAVKKDGVTSCTTEMNGRYAVTEKPFADLTKTLRIKAGTGTSCSSGAVVIVENSEAGVEYELAKGGVRTGNIVTGDGNDVEFPDPVVDAGATYTVYANMNGCEDVLDNTIVIDVPGAVQKFNVTGAGDICNGDPGVNFGLDGSEPGVVYSLFLVDGNGTGNDKQIGASVAGTGNAVTFDLANEEGEYYVIGDNGVDCALEMLNRVTLTVNPLPVAFKMIGSGFFCDVNEGAEIGLDGQEYSVKYILQFDDGSGNRNWAEATGGAQNDTIIFGRFTDEGLYTVVGITDKGCTSNMNGEVTVVQKSAPVDYNVLVSDSVYCSSEPGVEFMMEHSETDIVYTVYDEFGTFINETTGTGADSLSLGMFTQGTYTVIGSLGGDACKTPMNGGNKIKVTEILTPVKFNVSAEHYNVCGSSENNIILDGSEDGREYFILAGGINLNDTITGTGDTLKWSITSTGADTTLYEVVAISEGMCDLSMGKTEVIYKSSPAIVGLITEGDTTQYCAGTPGIVIGIDTSEVNIVYQLLDENSDISDFAAGTGDTIYFSNNHTEGDYIVKAVDFNTGCYTIMPDTIRVIENPMPEIYKLFLQKSDGSTTECEDQCTGLVNADTVKLEMSQDFVSYLLWLDENNTGTPVPVDTLQGTLDELSFGSPVYGGIYTIEGVTQQGCRTFMSGSAYMYQSPLIAVNDMFSLTKDKLIGQIKVADNDILLNGVDNLEEPDKNIFFELDTSWTYLDENNVAQEFSTIGQVSINDMGELEYQKLPSFYGRDSVRYIIYNSQHPERLDTATVFIFVGNVDMGDDESFLIPNAFSPNSDGINDKFVITGIKDKQESRLEVFNRWGTLVYRSKGQNYNNDWDGKSTESNMVSLGEDLPNGTYFYVFSVKFTREGKVISKQYSGYIELRR